MSLILTEETWVAARAERDRRRAAAAARPGGRAGRPDDRRLSTVGSPRRRRGRGAPSAGPDAAAADPDRQPLDAAQPVASQPVGYEPATLEDGTPVPASELAQVLCDCAVTRIAIGADGTPLDLGRTQRLFTGEQRRAVIARDRECIWPGCHMPARWSQIHHIVWWERDNGTTCVDDGCLLCAFHHHEVHRLDLTITRITRTPDESRRGTRHPVPGRRAPDHPAPRHPVRPPGSAPPGSGPPGRRRRRTTIALVDYELRDPTGRLIGEPPTERAPAALR